MPSEHTDGASPAAGSAGVHVLFQNWRDCASPEGGGSEIYVETVARALAAGGNRVTLHAARFPGAPAEEVRDDVRIVRSGSKLSVYPRALGQLRRGALGTPDVVVDVQNGVPFASTLATSAPVVVLVHHVHREQWPVVYDPIRARIGWWIESRVGPRAYRRCQYVAVSEATRRELAVQGIDPARIAVVHNGVRPRVSHAGDPRGPRPEILVLGRLVPHKRVEHVLEAARQLRRDIPGLMVSVVGDGWWREELASQVERWDLRDVVTLHGFVDEDTKQALLQRSWVLALPSLKEGWGLVVTEAAAHGVPAVAYRDAGGVAEAIQDGVSGLLADTQPEFTAALRRVLVDRTERERLGRGARARADSLSWQSTVTGFAQVLGDVLGRPVPVGPVEQEATLTAQPVPAAARTRQASAPGS